MSQIKPLLIAAALLAGGGGAVSADNISLNGIKYEILPSNDWAFVTGYTGTDPVFIPQISYGGKTYEVHFDNDFSFEGDTKLKSVTFADVNLPGGSRICFGEIYKDFKGCSNLEKVMYPDAQTTCTSFYNCPKMHPTGIEFHTPQATEFRVAGDCFSLSEPTMCGELTLDDKWRKFNFEGLHNNTNRYYEVVDDSKSTYPYPFEKDEILKLTTSEHGYYALPFGPKITELDITAARVFDIPSTVTKLTYRQLVKEDPEEYYGFDTGYQSDESALTEIIFHTDARYPINVCLQNCNYLKEISLPENSRFSAINCPLLTTINGQENIKYLELSNLPVTTLNLPNVEEIQGIQRCKELTEVTIGPSLKKVGDNPFSVTKQMKDLIFTGTLEQWNAVDFRVDDVCPEEGILRYVERFWYGHKGKQTYLTELDQTSLGDAHRINRGAFTSYKGLTKVDLSEKIDTLGRYAFAGCPNLKDVTLRCRHISHFAFATTPVQNLTLGNQLEKIGQAFNAYKLIPEVNFLGTWKDWAKIEHFTYSDNEREGDDPVCLPGYVTADLADRAQKLLFNGQPLETLELQGGDTVNNLKSVRTLKSIIINLGTYDIKFGNAAFANCIGLKSISYKYPARVRANGNVAGVHIGERAFVGCTNLETFDIAEHLESLGEMALTGTPYHSAQSNGPVYYTLKNGDRVLHEIYKGTIPENWPLNIPQGTVAVHKALSESDFETYANIKYVSLPQGMKYFGETMLHVDQDYLSIPASLEGNTIPSGKFRKISFEDTADTLYITNSAGVTADHIYFGRPIKCWSGNYGDEPRLRISTTGTIEIGETIGKIAIEHVYCSWYDLNKFPANVVCHSVTPPEVEDYAQVILYRFWAPKTTLIVPASALDTYKAHDIWGQFKDIRSIESSGVESIDEEAENWDNAETYTLQGVRVQGTPAHGLYIQRQGTSTRKVML